MSDDVVEYRRGRRVTWWHRAWRRFMPEPMETFETVQPWVIYTYGVPDWVTRFTGRAVIRTECAICGATDTVRIRIPRWGPVLDRGPHPARLAFLAAHRHLAQARDPETWARPLRNPSVLGPGAWEALLERAALAALTDYPGGTDK